MTEDLPAGSRADEGAHLPSLRLRIRRYVQPACPLLMPLAWVWQKLCALWLRLHGWP
jgi:hypothetical protein